MQKDELSDLTKRDLYEMSKAEQVDIHAKVWFQREPWYLTEKWMRREVIEDDSARVPDSEHWQESQDRSL